MSSWHITKLFWSARFWSTPQFCLYISVFIHIWKIMHPYSQPQTKLVYRSQRKGMLCQPWQSQWWMNIFAQKCHTTNTRRINWSLCLTGAHISTVCPRLPCYSNERMPQTNDLSVVDQHPLKRNECICIAPCMCCRFHSYFSNKPGFATSHSVFPPLVPEQKVSV